MIGPLKPYLAYKGSSTPWSDTIPEERSVQLQWLG